MGFVDREEEFLEVAHEYMEQRLGTVRAEVTAEEVVDAYVRSDAFVDDVVTFVQSRFAGDTRVDDDRLGVVDITSEIEDYQQAVVEQAREMF